MDNSISFKELDWDTEFFGVTCAKAVLHQPLNKSDWNELKLKFNDYEFISIVNENSEPLNAQLIGKETNAFLADVNIQFKKKISGSIEASKNVTIHKSLERNNQILELSTFQFSKFVEDPELAKRGGELIYREWLINSFNKQNKFFALSKNKTKLDINGFLLYSYLNNECVIELIAVNQNETNRGIGIELFNTIENDAYQQGIKEIKVGTQVRNINAINFYHKVGCKQVGCHQVFHLWNL